MRQHDRNVLLGEMGDKFKQALRWYYLADNPNPGRKGINAEVEAALCLWDLQRMIEDNFPRIQRNERIYKPAIPEDELERK